MSSFSLLSNIAIIRLQGVRSLPNTTISPKIGDVFSSGLIKLTFRKETFFQNSPTLLETFDWQGEIKIIVTDIKYNSNYNFSEIYSEMTFENQLSSEIFFNTIPSTNKDEIFNNSLPIYDNVIKFSENQIMLSYWDDGSSQNQNTFNSVMIYGNLYENIKGQINIDTIIDNCYYQTTNYINFSKIS